MVTPKAIDTFENDGVPAGYAFTHVKNLMGSAFWFAAAVEFLYTGVFDYVGNWFSL